jgi:chemotaxis protein CheX
MLSTEDIVAITQNIFETMLQTQVDQSTANGALDSKSSVVGCIHIAGEWSGVVLVKASDKLASFAASRMLLIDPDDVQVNDLQDTLAELTNMIGGNIKSIVPGPSNLSLPTVTNGSDFQIRTFGVVPISSTNFDSEEGSFQVIVLECQSTNRS